MTTAPIACTLSGSDFKERLAWITDLNRTWLRSAKRDDLRLVLTYDVQAGATIQQMVEREQACCPFLSFETMEQPDILILNVRAPEEAREAADAVFEPFIRTGTPQAACSCCGAAA